MKDVAVAAGAAFLSEGCFRTATKIPEYSQGPDKAAKVRVLGEQIKLKADS